MLKQTAGFVSLCFGGMFADSEYMIIPLLLLIVGAYLITHGE